MTRLRAIDAALPAADGVRAFNHMYLTVTLLVRERIGAGFFAGPAAVRELDVTFAGLYLAAYDAGARGAPVPRAWRPLFARRADSRVEPIQFAVAGMNAHINNDLPLAVVATCERLGTAPDAFHADYLKVNDVLAAVEREVRESYLDLPLPVVDLVGTWSIERARDAAWVNADVLWRLRGLAFARDRFAETLAGSVGLASGTLLTPLR